MGMMLIQRNLFSAALLAGLAATLTFTGCQREYDAEVLLNFDAEWQGSTFAVGGTTLDSQGREVQLERLECYVSEFSLHDVEAGWIDIDTVARIDFSSSNPHAVLKLRSDQPWTFDGIRMGLGVPADRNVDVDPAGYADPNHPLGFSGSAGMHWGWAAGYIFSVYEGRLLTDPNLPFAYHAGSDTCFRTVELTWTEAQTVDCDHPSANLTLVLDAYKCLHGDEDVIDPEVDPETHTGNNLPLALRWVDLYQSAWSVRP